MTESADRFEYTGINHIALVTKDMAMTVDFYHNVLDMPLIKTADLPDNKGQHFFFDMGGQHTVAFFMFPGAPEIAPGIASRHRDPAKYGNHTAHASLNHLAFSVPLERFEENAERLRRRGVEFFMLNHEDTDRHRSTEVNEHTWIRSIYFFDPNGILLEMGAFTREFTEERDVVHDPMNEKGERVPLTKLIGKKPASIAA